MVIIANSAEQPTPPKEPKHQRAWNGGWGRSIVVGRSQMARHLMKIVKGVRR